MEIGAFGVAPHPRLRPRHISPAARDGQSSPDLSQQVRPILSFCFIATAVSPTTIPCCRPLAVPSGVRGLPPFVVRSAPRCHNRSDHFCHSATAAESAAPALQSCSPSSVRPRSAAALTSIRPSPTSVFPTETYRNISPRPISAATYCNMSPPSQPAPCCRPLVVPARV